MAVMWRLTRAAVKLSFFQDNDLSHSMPHMQGSNKWGTRGARFSGRRITVGMLKSHNNVTSTSFSTVHLILKDLKVEHGGAKLASCPGHLLTTLPTCTLGKMADRSIWQNIKLNIF